MIENSKEIIEKLNRYTFIEKNTEYITKKIKLIEEELSRVKVSSFDENRGGINDYRVEKLLDEKTKLEEKANKLKLEKKFTLELVNLLDKLEKEIVIEFYFKKYSISKIAFDKKYSYRYINKIKQNALKKLEVYLF